MMPSSQVGVSGNAFVCAAVVFDSLCCFRFVSPVLETAGSALLDTEICSSVADVDDELVSLIVN